MRRIATFVPAFPLFALALACSSGSSRAAFSEGEIAPTEPAAAEPEAPPPSKSAPVAPTGDAAAPDANDGCARAAPSKACGLVPQCGCAASETCDVTDIVGNVACVAAGKAQMGRPCTSTSGCAAGLTCVGGTCHAYCAAAGSACTTPGTGACVQLQSDGADVPNLKVCRVSCDLRDATACGGTTAAGTGVCAVDALGNTDCLSGGTGAENAACSPTAECGPALACVDITQNGTTSSKCKRWCRVGTADCGGAGACTGFATKVLVGGVEHGVCP